MYAFSVTKINAFLKVKIFVDSETANEIHGFVCKKKFYLQSTTE